MVCTLKISTHSPNDLHVIGDLPFSVGATSYADHQYQVNFVVHRDGSILSSGVARRSTDRSLKVPSDLHIHKYRGISPGTYTIQAIVGSSGGVGLTDSVSIRVFQAPSVSVNVANQAQFTSALNAAKVATNNHTRIILSAGSYVWDVDASARDGLISVEAALGASVFMACDTPFGSVYPVVNAYWYGISFVSSGGACYSARVGGRCVFERCQFAASPVGISVPAGAGVRVEECHFSDLTDALIGVGVVRSCTWNRVSGVVAQNCNVIDGLFGDRALVCEDQSLAEQTLRVCRFSSPVSGVVIRSVASIGDFGKLIDMPSAENSNVVIVGNTVNSTAVTLASIGGLSGSIVAHNSMHSSSTESGPTITFSGAIRNSAVVNNWFSRVDRTFGRLSGQTVDANYASDAPASGTPVQVGVVSAPFANNYLFPLPDSTLRFAGSSRVDLGIKNVQGNTINSQAGALDYTASPSSAYSSMRTNSDFSFIGPDIESFVV